MKSDESQQKTRELLYRLSAAVLPLLIFWAVYEVVLSLLQIFVSGLLGKVDAGSTWELLLLHAADLNAFLSMLSLAAAMLAVARTAGAEIRAFQERQKHVLFRLGLTELVHTPVFTALLFVTVFCLYLGLNLLLSLTGAAGKAGDSALQQTSVTFSLGLAAYGIISPFVEEAVFRGLTLGRLLRLLQWPAAEPDDTAEDSGLHTRKGAEELHRPQTLREREEENRKRRSSTIGCLLFSALLFALWHGNVPQGLLGLVLGLVFGLAYYLTGNFLMTVLLHAGCNILALLLVQTGLYTILCTPAWCAGLLAAAAAGGVCLFFSLSGAGRR